jgi:hypothetical protein
VNTFNTVGNTTSNLVMSSVVPPTSILCNKENAQPNNLNLGFGRAAL